MYRAPTNSAQAQRKANGVDCSAIQHATNVKCQSSRCMVTKCDPGFEVSPSGDSCDKRSVRRGASPYVNVDIDAVVNAMVSILNHDAKSHETEGQLVNADVDAIVNIVVSVLNYYKHMRRDYGSLINVDVDAAINAVVSILNYKMSRRDDAPHIAQRRTLM